MRVVYSLESRTIPNLSCPPPAAKGLSLTATITQESKEGKKGQGGRKMEGREVGREEGSKAGRNIRMKEGINKG